MNGTYTTIIIDDEDHARFRLKEVLAETDKFKIIGEASDGIEGKSMINKLKPEVVFLDIQMPGLDGFEMLEQIVYDPYIIFCTAFNQYAIKAFETFSVDYLLKPIEFPRLIKTIGKLHRLSEQEEMVKQFRNDRQNRNLDKIAQVFSSKIGDRYVLTSLDQIAWFEADDKSVSLFTMHGKKLPCDYSLQLLEDKLPSNFLRVSRSVVVNMNCITECRKYSTGKFILILNDMKVSRIETGFSYSDNLKKLIGANLH